MKYPYVMLLVIFCLISYQSISQKLHFQSYASAQGLSQNSIYSIAQTRDGFMWFGTQDGMNRFDGQQFTTYVPAASNYKEFSKFSKMITALYADNNDQLWVGSTQEIALYNRYTNKFILPASIYPGFSMPKDPWIVKIAEDRNGNIWILTTKSGIFCYSKKLKKMLPIVWEGKIPGNIISWTCDSGGNVLVASETEIFQLKDNIFHPIGLKKILTSVVLKLSDICMVNDQLWVTNASNIFIFTPNNHDSYSLSSFAKIYKGERMPSDPRLIHQSDVNTVWIGSRSNGVIRIDLEKKTFQNSEESGGDYALKKPFILSIFTNVQGITWIGISGAGLAKYDSQKSQINLWQNYPTLHNPLPDNMLLSLFTEDDTSFYIGTLTGGLMYKNTQTGYYQYFQPDSFSPNSAESKNIYGIIAGENNLIWLATWGGLFSFDKHSKQFIQYTDPTDSRTKELCALIRLKKQNKILTGGYANGLRLFDINTKKWERCKDIDHILDKYVMRVRYMKEMEDGNIYMSTEAQSLVCYNYISGKFTFFPALQKISGTSRYFSFDNENLWIATDDGLIQVKAKTMQIIKIWSTRNGLSNDYIYAVVPDSSGRVWLSSNAGINVLDYKSGFCKKFTEGDGLQSMEFNTAACLKDSKGRIWFGGINGLNMVEPKQTYDNNFSPAPLIINIQVMNNNLKGVVETPYIRSITLPYSKNFISLEFQAPNYSQSENIIYEHTLIGVDTGWIRNGSRNYVSYTQLSPGNYKFRVRSANANYVWSKETTELIINIIPPWYRTWWFYVTSMATLMYLLYAFYQFRLRQIKNLEQVRNRISRDLHDDIGSTLSSINILSQMAGKNALENSADKTTDIMEKINERSQRLLDNMSDIVWSIKPENDSLEELLTRMRQYATDILESKGIDYTIDFPKEKLEYKFSLEVKNNLYLIFKEAVNNLCKYAQCQHAYLSLSINHKIMTVLIRDDGIGFSTDIPAIGNGGNGLKNMRQRAAEIKAQLLIESTPGEGTSVSLLYRLL
jgi:signal transduction histidine kinase/ligand-binding sensor domain-containing protein